MLQRPLCCSIAVAFLLASQAVGQCYRSGPGNFQVCGSDAATNAAVAEACEAARKTWAVRWFGREFPDWSAPAKITVKVRPMLGAGGSTAFAFARGEVFGWEGEWQGNREELIATVVPHEVTHMLFATWFRKPLPRWIDEGCAMLAEPEAGRTNPRAGQIRWEPLRQFLDRTQYPRDIGSMYSQALLLSEWIVWQRGYRAMPALVERHFETRDWDADFRALLGSDVATIEPLVVAWTRAGRPAPPGGRQGVYAWTGNGWARRTGQDATASARTPMAPLVPVQPTTHTAQGPLWDWLQGGQAPQTVPGVTPSTSTATTGPTWEQPATTPQVLPGPGPPVPVAPVTAPIPLAGATPSPPDGQAETQSMLGKVLGAITGVQQKADHLDEKLDATAGQVKAAAVAAAEDAQQGVVSKIKTYGGWGLGIALAWFSLGPYGVIGFVVKKAFAYATKELRERAATGKPTDWEEWASKTPTRIDDIVAGALSSFGASHLKQAEDLGNKMLAKVESLAQGAKQPAMETAPVGPAVGTVKGPA